MKFKDIVLNNPFTIAVMCFATVISGVTFVYSKVLAIAELVVIISVAVFALRWMADTFDRKKQQIRWLEASLTENGEIASEFGSFPLPVVLVKKHGDIVWFNKHFEQVLNGYKDIRGLNIEEIISFSENVLKSGTLKPFEANNTVSQFTVFPSLLHDELYALYFIDDTQLKNTRHSFNITRPVVLLINTDSLEQTEDAFAHADYYSINSDIDRIISKWLVANNCIFRKFSDGKFIAVTEYLNLEKMINAHFDILDKVREYNFAGEDMDITLSVGVGKEDSFRECEMSARQALDMARGRGGDQVAIKVKDNYEFFGGITNRKEKRGKVKSRTVAAALDEFIENCSNVLIMGHSYSDFDCIGAAVGIAAIAKSCGKTVHIIVNKKNTLASPLLKMLESDAVNADFISPDKAWEIANNDTLLVITDTMRIQLVEAPHLIEKKLRMVIIDHHRMTVDHIEGASLLFHEPYASSACEMVTELVQYAPSKPKLTSAQAQALLAGILLDTKNFTLRVGVRTFEAAAFLRDCKSDMVKVRKLFAGSAEENQNVSKIITAAKFYKHYAIAVSDIDSPSSRLICSKAADELLNIENVDASFVISQREDGSSISARSLGKINVQLIMESLGGGGHQSMAACQLPGVNEAEAENKLHEAIEAYFAKTK